VAALCGAAAAGLWIGARWGWNAALVVLSANLVGDMTNALVRGDRRTLIGVPIALALIAYVVRTRPARRPNPAVAGRT
jgi:hypothetical protein